MTSHKQFTTIVRYMHISNFVQTMASAEIALVCGLKVRVGCQNRLRVNSDADEALA